MQQNPKNPTFLILGRWSRSWGGSRVWVFSSMFLFMKVMIAGIRESFLTHWTHKGLFSCVCSDMNHQLLRPMESLVTLGARVLLLPHVSFYMVPQASSLGKSLFTLRAAVGLHPCMDSTVFVQAIRPWEGLVTGGAGEGLISCVCSLVTLQGQRHRESLVTLGAGVLLLPHVSFNMCPQASSLGKSLFTLRAGEGLPSCVDSTVIA